MKRLAKVGYSQSYSYFTWRNLKWELQQYLTELTTEDSVDYMRPNFFVNTPDINPRYLQTSGRPGFQIRLALAATLGGNYGVYSGYELCEYLPVQGKEEYLNSEKYEIRAFDWKAPGNIREDIAFFNRIRRSEPALRSFRDLAFYNFWNDNVLYYGKRTPDLSSFLLFIVNLDPHNPQGGNFEVPLWELGLPDDGTVHVANQWRDVRLARQDPELVAGPGGNALCRASDHRLEPVFRLQCNHPAAAAFLSGTLGHAPGLARRTERFDHG
jgi:starch synthase (maltosyl-transferring)